MERVIAVCLMTTEAFKNMNLCYILDGILLLYGVVLTVFYFRLRMTFARIKFDKKSENPSAEGGIYVGLTSSSTDTYEEIRRDK